MKDAINDGLAHRLTALVNQDADARIEEHFKAIFQLCGQTYGGVNADEQDRLRRVMNEAKNIACRAARKHLEGKVVLDVRDAALARVKELIAKAAGDAK